MVIMCELQWDFTILSGGLLCLLLVLIIFAILCAIFPSRVSEIFFLRDIFEVVQFPIICSLVLICVFTMTMCVKEMCI